MIHFVKPSIAEKTVKRRGRNEYIKVIYPEYRRNCTDFMMKGGKFFAAYIPETGLWSTDEDEMMDQIDKTLYEFRDKISKEDAYGIFRTEEGDEVQVNALVNSGNKELINFRTWESKLAANHKYRALDGKLTYASDIVEIEDYRSKRLTYDLVDGDISAYDRIMSTLYSPEEREKIEWAIGSIFAGDSVHIEKMVALYGDPGTGKSTILNLIKNLFDGYWAPFSADALTRKNDQFATSAFKDNPLVAIQDDGSMAKIESPIINEIISHSDIIINEKGKQRYKIKPSAMLFIATNEAIDIHDTKLGISRRLLDVYPSGNKIPVGEYRKCISQLKFEYGAIAKHCLNVYESMGPEYYLDYVPTAMIDKTNIMRNFVFDNYDKFKMNDPITRDVAYEWYKAYFEESGLGYPPKRIIFGDQLKEYYSEYKKIGWTGEGNKRHVYKGFKYQIFAYKVGEKHKEEERLNKIPEWLQLTEQHSIFDDTFAECHAQYAKGDNDIPETSWDNCKTDLKNLSTGRTHYLLTQELEPKLIVIDFDIRDKEGKKSFVENVEEASKWPKTYAELSKGGEGIHLHYIYNGDVAQLASVYSLNVEVKVFTGKQALRRRVSKCNKVPIAILQPGPLPLKGDKKKVINWDGIKSEKMLRSMVEKNLRKEYHTATKPSVDYICTLIEDAYNKGLQYDLSDLKPDILAFASQSTHHSKDCLKAVKNLHYSSEDIPEPISFINDEIVFYDVEVFPNVFICCYKKQGEGNKVVKMIQPKPDDIKELCKFKLVGFNNRRYDNHILYAWMMGYTNEQLYKQSQMIINSNKNAFFGQAYNLSYTDIYDFSAKKQSLKKFEIELGLHHLENSYPWDQPLPEERWDEVADYCCNDVLATEATFNARYSDYEARCVLAKIAGGTPNDTTNSLTTKLIFGDNKHPQDEFVYTDLSKMFPGYKYEDGKSTYKGVEVGEGGYVYADHGMWRHVVTNDVASMHPHSAIALNIFGDRYTKRFADLVNARIAIKHKDTKVLKTIFDGAFSEFTKASDDELKNLASALKIAINSVYGLTAAKFDNPFRDPRNIDNIVAKRGALFMIDLKEEVEKRHGHVVHIKTDSIKVENPTDELQQFILDFGKKYGYDFEIESKYERMCLVNDAVYIAKEEEPHESLSDKAGRLKNDKGWVATGTQFQHPYVFRTLFSKLPVDFEDMCETKSTTTAFYLDLNENLPEDTHAYHFVGKVGQFTPIRKGQGGGLLLRQNKDGITYAAATGTKGYRWLESNMVKELDKIKDVDISYYRDLVEKAKEAIKENCINQSEADWFISGEPWVLEIDTDELPF